MKKNYKSYHWAEIVEEPKVETKEEFVLPEYWFLRFKTKEVFDELCKKYAPDFIFFENAGICNNPTKLKLGNYYYLTKDTRYGEEITFDQFKKYVLKQEVKSMKEWSVGSYVVWLTQFKEFKIKVGTIDEISEAGDSRGMGSTKLFGSTAFLQRNNKNLKWFPTLQEAQKFSDELLDKSKTSLSVEDLIEGEFYRHNENGNIFKWAKNKQFYLGDSQTSFEYADGCWEGPFSLANASEVKWLKTCIKQDKFIEQSELDKYDDEGNLIQNFEFGKWYKSNSGHLYYIKSKKEFYGFNNCTDWVNYTHGDLNLNGFVLASDKEVSDRLLEYAMSKYPVGTKFKSCYQQNLATVIDLNYKWVDYYKAVENSDGVLVYQSGNWAEIVEYPKEQIHEIHNSNQPTLENNFTPIRNNYEVSGINMKSFEIIFNESCNKTQEKFIEEMFKKNPLVPEECRKIKIPKLIDRSKLDVKIKETKVKQIKL